jgi:hypothetical protein
MASWEDVRRVVQALPETAEGPTHDALMSWRVKGKLIAWERPLRKADLEALGGAAPEGEILGARVPDVETKDALIAERPDVYFTTPHFDGYPAILARLDVIDADELHELIVEAWLDRAPKRLAREYLAEKEVE